MLFAVVLCSALISAPKSYTVKRHKIYHSKGFVRKPMEFIHKKLETVTIPNSIDLRGKISPVRDQGQCGSCYAFGTSSALRDALMLQGKDPGELSPQYLMDYSGNGCNGGYFDVMDLAKSPKGLPLESLYPYIATSENPRASNPAGSIVSWSMLNASPRAIETYMAEYGYPVAISMAAGAGDFESYSGGIYNGCTFQDPDHVVAIVGFNNENAKFNSKGFLPNGTGYWIVRNSWGANWGENGFFRIRMTDSKGKKCNNVGADASGFFFKKSHGTK